MVPGALRPGMPKHAGGIKEWLLRGSWSPTRVIGRRRLRLSVHDASEYEAACVSDSISLTSAAFESALGFAENPAEPRACAWQAISYYYAGYFAANALMRLTGHCCVNLDQRVCAEMSEQTRLYLGQGSLPRDYESGVYFLSRLSTGQGGEIELSQVSARGGVHVQLWVAFQQFLAILEKEIDRGPLPEADRRGAMNEIHLLRATLTQSGCAQGNWLSEIRNGINYRLEQGLWFPYENCRNSSTSLLRSVRSSLQASALTTPAAVADVEHFSRVVGVLLAWIHNAFDLLGDKARNKKKMLILGGILEPARLLMAK